MTNSEELKRAREWMGCHYNFESDELFSHHEQADDQLMHALLAQKYESKNEMTDRVERILPLLETDSSSRLALKINANIKTVWTALGGIAAAIVVVFTTFLSLTPANPAFAAIDRIIQNIEQTSDRHYSVQVKTKKKKILNVENIGAEEPRFDYADLYLRGAEQFVIIERRSDGKGFIKGNDGQKSWQISGKSRTLKSGDESAIKLPLSSNSRDLSFLNIVETLQKLKDDYALEIQYKQPLPNAEKLWTKVTAEKKNQNIKGVKRVILFFDSNEFFIKKIIFDGTHLPGERNVTRIVLNLKSTTKLPDDFFSSTAHIEK